MEIPIKSTPIAELFQKYKCVITIGSGYCKIVQLPNEEAIYDHICNYLNNSVKYCDNYITFYPSYTNGKYSYTVRSDHGSHRDERYSFDVFGYDNNKLENLFETKGLDKFWKDKDGFYTYKYR